MMVKPMKTLELHYPMIQFLIIHDILWYYLNNFILNQLSQDKHVYNSKS